MVVNKNLYVKTNKELTKLITDYKKKMCPTYSGKSKEQLINIVENLNLVKPFKKKEKPAPKPKKAEPKPKKTTKKKELSNEIKEILKELERTERGHRLSLAIYKDKQTAADRIDMNKFKEVYDRYNNELFKLTGKKLSELTSRKELLKKIKSVD